MCLSARLAERIQQAGETEMVDIGSAYSHSFDRDASIEDRLRNRCVNFQKTRDHAFTFVTHSAFLDIFITLEGCWVQSEFSKSFLEPHG